MILIILLVFLLATAIDTFYILWFHFSDKEKEHKAAACSVAIYLVATINLLLIVESKWLIVPDLIGLYVGSIIGIRIKRKINTRDS